MKQKLSKKECRDKVTIVALCYNQSRYLQRTLDSIVNQSCEPEYFYIIDDGSTDNSVELIEQWNRENGQMATLIVHEVNQGITRTMNHALSLCTTKYFHPWPCDDLLMPDKIESQINYMESLDWQPGFLYGDIQWIDDKDNVLRDSVIVDRKKLFKDGKMPSGFIFKELIQFGCFIPTASGLYVTKVLNDLGGFDEELFAEDWDMFMRIALHSGIAFKNQVFSQYRRHSSSAEVSKGEKYWDGHFKILPKYLGAQKGVNTLIWDKIGRDALQAHREGFGNCWRWIWRSALKTQNIKLLYSYLRVQRR